MQRRAKLQQHLGRQERQNEKHDDSTCTEVYNSLHTANGVAEYASTRLASHDPLPARRTCRNAIALHTLEILTQVRHFAAVAR